MACVFCIHEPRKHKENEHRVGAGEQQLYEGLGEKRPRGCAEFWPRDQREMVEHHADGSHAAKPIKAQDARVGGRHDLKK